MSNSHSSHLGSKIRHAMTQWLLPLYKWIGAGYPKATLLAFFILGGLLFGGMWYLTGREYQESLKKNPPAGIADNSNIVPKQEEWSVEISKLIRTVCASKRGKWASMTVDTSALSSFAQDYSLIMLVRVMDNHIEALTDTRIVKSSLFTITGEVRTIEVPLTDDFIAKSDAIGQNHPQMSLQFFLALIPKHIRSEQILTIGDITALGGRQLRSNPAPEFVSRDQFQ